MVVPDMLIDWIYLISDADFLIDSGKISQNLGQQKSHSPAKETSASVPPTAQELRLKRLAYLDKSPSSGSSQASSAAIEGELTHKTEDLTCHSQQKSGMWTIYIQIWLNNLQLL